MPHYMLILHERPSDFADLSPDEMQRIIEKYRAWRTNLMQAGRLTAGQKLRDEPGKVLRGRDGGVKIVDGPFSETKEVIGGYFVIEAADYQDAAAVARDCPHLSFGGAIELREVEPT